MTLVRLGDRAWRFEVPAGVARRTLFDSLRAIAGVEDVVLAEELGCVVHRGALDRAVVDDVLTRAPRATADAVGKEHVIHVLYDGPDLDAVAARVGSTSAAVIAAHAEREYTVAMLGFLPGFGYLRGLDPRLVLPRRDEPRARVPASSVAIAAEYTGIYPFASPGGWHLLGRAIDFTPLKAEGATLSAGDRVRFVPTNEAPPPQASTQATRSAPEGPHLEVTAMRGVGILVDAGRSGHMHEGVPPGGPLVARALARANAAVGNATGACAIELFGELRVTARGGALRLGDDRGRAIDLGEGETHGIATSSGDRVRYLAVGGGIDVPIFLGGQGTLLVARIGGVDGQPLRRGDLLASPTTPSREIDPRRTSGTFDRIPIVPGPDVDERRLSLAMTTASFRIMEASDRTGTRLDGPKLVLGEVDARRASRPMVIGAIELTPSGLIVLGPDHPTTGGYPIVGVVRTDALDAFFARPPGARVSFVVA